MTQKLLLSLAVVIIGVATSLHAAALNRPPYIQCQSNLECMPGNCCTIGPNKFSIPQCKPMQEDGGTCRPSGHATLNTTLIYPDGTLVTLTDVHYMFCPCTYGLSCDESGDVGICRDSSQNRGFNHLLGDKSTEDD